MEGIIATDLKNILTNHQKIEKQTLNSYLNANQLAPKHEISFKDMNNAFH